MGAIVVWYHRAMSPPDDRDRGRVIYPTEPPWFAHSATLRIHGDALDFDEISRTLGVSPTHTHRRADRKGRRSEATYRDDAWHYSPAIPEERSLTDHLLALWMIVRPHVDYLVSLKERYTVDIFCGYGSNNQTAGFEVDHRCLEMFIALQVPFGVSVITLE